MRKKEKESETERERERGAERHIEKEKVCVREWM